MKEIFIVVVLCSFIMIDNLRAQNESELTNAKKAINELLNFQNDSLIKNDRKKVDRLFNLSICQNTKNDNSSHVEEFNFMGNQIFRFYIYVITGKVKLTLFQKKGGLENNLEEKVLFEITKDEKEKGVSFYDYKVTKDNDFILKLQREGNEKTCAFVTLVRIIPDAKRIYDVTNKKWILIYDE